ncbi:MAG: hypothetical protein P1U90_22605, partial [Akkermansiaceae bacterium]|nr:hypothetical protein [Akkermansiaceae bacterium]
RALTPLARMAGRLVSSGTLGFCFIFCFLFSYDGTFTRVFRPMQGSPLDHHLAYYQEKPELADQLVSVGEFKTDTSIPKHELAAWTLIASQIFNLDETLSK